MLYDFWSDFEANFTGAHGQYVIAEEERDRLKEVYGDAEEFYDSMSDILKESLYWSYEYYFKNQSLNVDLTYDEVIQTAECKQIEDSLIWTKAGKAYFELKHEDKADEDAFLDGYDMVKDILEFVRNMREVEFKAKVTYDKYYFQEKEHEAFNKPTHPIIEGFLNVFGLKQRKGVPYEIITMPSS